MVTGDQRLIAIETCRRLGMGTNIMEGCELMAGNAAAKDLAAQVTEVDGFAGVYPEHKHRIVSALQSKGCLVGMTGVLAHAQDLVYHTLRSAIQECQDLCKFPSMLGMISLGHLCLRSFASLRAPDVSLRSRLRVIDDSKLAVSSL